MPDRQAEMRLMLRALRLPAIAAVYEDLALKAVLLHLRGVLGAGVKSIGRHRPKA